MKKNEQRCFGNYEAAFHYDCQICNDQECKFRKGCGCNKAFIGVVIMVLVIVISKILHELKVIQ